MMKALSSPRGSVFTSFSSPKRVAFAASTTTNLVQLVGGMDISSWETVEVVDVQPGSLGIGLDASCTDGAVLQCFKPLPDGTKGAIELDGRVVPGSVLVAVNEYDLVEQKLSLDEISQVLRDTTTHERTLCFKVPPVRSLDAIEASGISSAGSPTSSAVGELEERVLIKGMDNSSFKEKHTSGADGAKRSWNIMSLLSPSQVASSLATMSGLGMSPNAAMPVTPVLPPEEPVVSPPVTPTATTTVRAASHTLSSKSLYDSNKLAAKIPPGPIGLNLDGSITDRAVVLGFLPLPDGSSGVLERRGDIPVGSVLVAVNGSSVTHLKLDEIRARLGALASFERELVFELPVQPDGSSTHALSAKDRANAFQRLSDLDKRRKIELGLVLKHDSNRIKRHECWFLIDAQWMARWVEFTAKGGVNPGAITNHVLLEHDWEARVSGLAPGRPDAPRAGLELLKDYRCVTPMVWALLAELHGTNNVPVQARYVLDAYAEPLAATEVTPILTEPQLKAATIVNELRERYPGAFAS